MRGSITDWSRSRQAARLAAAVSPSDFAEKSAVPHQADWRSRAVLLQV